MMPLEGEPVMYGAMIGDIVGSVYEFENIKTKDFPLFSDNSVYTDDTIMTVAVGRALLRARNENIPLKPCLIEEIKNIAQRYPNPKGGYGIKFAAWLKEKNPKPYYSFGNGAAMRTSPCGLIAVTLQEALDFGKAQAEISHNHPEGIKGAKAVAGAVFLAKTGKSKEEIKNFIENNFYKLDKTIDEIRKNYSFDETCQGTVPQAIQAFLESTDYVDAIRNAISLGGDSDTLGAITGSIAWAYYTKFAPYEITKFQFETYYETSIEMRNVKDEARDILPLEFCGIAEEFDKYCSLRAAAFDRIGVIQGISIE